MNKDIQTYNNAQTPTDKEICSLLAKEICAALPEAENKIWHAHPEVRLPAGSSAIYLMCSLCLSVT